MIKLLEKKKNELNKLFISLFQNNNKNKQATTMNNDEYNLLEICPFDFEDERNWVKTEKGVKDGVEFDLICDLCYKEKAEFTTFQCAGWENGKVGGFGGGDIHIDYCADCRRKKRRHRVTSRCLMYNSEEDTK